MALTIRKVEYFYTTAADTLGSGYMLLTRLAGAGVNLLAFSAVPLGPARTQLTLFPEDPETLARVAEKEGFVLEGPHAAILVQGDDELGALADIHARLYDARVSVFASSGVTDGRQGYGYVLYVRPDEVDRAATALGV
jgi:hypothetical protein